ncbi:MAG: phosphomannomutase/phosphoglucomutase, partial [Clostridia bacterium]|nr:phosphomannomutase/phosphoglucomutase [Clostridia bacterium]
GFKLTRGYTVSVESEDVKEIYDFTINPPTPPPEKGKVETPEDAWSPYINAILSRIKMGPHKPRLVLDAGNGGAGLYAYEVFQRLGCMTFQLNCDPDDTYPHYFPNPSSLPARARLRQMVTHPYIRADLGLGFDGDGDRLGVIDGQGNDVYSDIILAMLAEQLLQKKPGAKVVYDVKCSQTLEDVIKANQGECVMWKTGHSYIKNKMQETGAPLAGERSGHIYFGGDEYYGFDDALFAGAKLVEYLSWRGSLTDALAKFPRYVTSPEINAGCPDTAKYGVIDAITEEFKNRYPGKVIDINGARVDFGFGWGLIRASSNLPEMVLIFEADSKENLMKIRGIFKEITGKYPEISQDWENDV